MNSQADTITEEKYYEISASERSRLCQINIASGVEYRRQLDAGLVPKYLHVDVRPGGARGSRRNRTTK